MKVLGIVSEYNPFHNGHKFHIEQSIKNSGCDFVIAVMSGNFVQRGEPAIFDKWTRTKAALLNGVDMVIEIPTYFSTSSAEFFAECAVRILENTGIVNMVSFGSESGHIEYIEKTANILYNEPKEFKGAIKKELSKGLPFPTARGNALKQIANIPNEILENPNNILGIEYIKSLKKINSNITPVTVKREKAHYNSKNIESTIASATAIREYIKTNDINTALSAIPKNCIDIYSEALNSKKAPIFQNDLSDFLNYKIRMSSEEYLRNILDVTEGLENRILKSLYACYDFNEICDYIKSKRYTYTKMQRAILHIILDIQKNDFYEFINNGFAQYIRVLGFNKKSSIVLSELTKKAKIPVITNVKNIYSQLDDIGLKMFEKEIQFTDIYSALSKSKNMRLPKREFSTPMVII